MRKLVYITAAAAAACALFAAGCSKNIDYSEYISERRFAIYMYEGDGESIKIYCSQKESPFVADGVRGNVTDLVEIYAEFDRNCDEVNISGDSISGGEMSYMTIKDCWYLSYGGAVSGDEVTVTIEADGTTESYTLIKVGAALTCEQALGCVVEYDGAAFENLTQGGVFNGEIFIRLLYDEKCYYYVGICDGQGQIHAYLADGETGRIIAEREYKM